jgi:hypothetical protein
MKSILVCACIFPLLCGVVSAQDIESTLSGSSSSQGFSVMNSNLSTLFTVRGDGKVGVGISTPDALLHINGQIKIAGGAPASGKILMSDANGLGSWITLPAQGVTLDQAYDWGGAGVGRMITADAGPVIVSGADGLLVTGVYGNGSTLVTGGGTRMMFYPKKAAFRAGGASTNQWEDANIGNYSAALGESPTASGRAAVALGASPVASGENAVAAGYGAIASNVSAIAIGNQVTASGPSAMAFGYTTTASGSYSTAMGSNVSTNNRTGAFVIGDNTSVTTLSAGVDNRFLARFSGGYRLWTNADLTIGIDAQANANSWSSISDSSRKESYQSAAAEHYLERFRALRLGSWSYIGDAPRRHYGPMAQEWFAAFGNDGVGVIGNDTTLASADVDGILCIAIKALEARTAELRATTDRIASLEAGIAKLQEELSTIQRLLTRLPLAAETVDRQQHSAVK